MASLVLLAGLTRRVTVLPADETTYVYAGGTVFSFFFVFSCVQFTFVHD